MKNVMIDLETWGKSPGCAIRSVGAVAFDLRTDRIDDTVFYANVDLRSCKKHGLYLEQDTKEWWETQPKDVVEQLNTNQQSVSLVVRNFHAWFFQQGATTVWSNGANFDEPIWTALARAVNAKVPWNFWNVRCSRTVCYIAGVDVNREKRKNSKHHALADAEHQARCLQKAYRILMLARDRETA